MGSSLTFLALNKKYNAPNTAEPKSIKHTNIFDDVPSVLWAYGSNAKHKMPTTANDRPINSAL